MSQSIDKTNITVEAEKVMATESIVICPLCGDPGKLKYSKLKDRLFGVSGRWEMKACLNERCGVLWLSLRPKESEIWKAYQTYYTHTTLATKSWKQRGLSGLQSLLVNAVLFFTGSLTEKKHVEDLLLTDLPVGQLLEIGCGDGEFLAKMKQRGWQVLGTDFDKAAAQTAKNKFNIDVHTEQLVDLKFKENSFDAIVMKHVFEHLYDAKKTLAEIYRILKPGGRLVIITPNAESWAQQNFAQDWRGLEPPRHIVIYTLKALAELAGKQNFKKVTAMTSAVHSWIVMSESFGLKDSGTAVRTSNRPSLKNILRALMIWPYILVRNKFQKTLGDELVLVVQK